MRVQTPCPTYLKRTTYRPQPPYVRRRRHGVAAHVMTTVQVLVIHIVNWNPAATGIPNDALLDIRDIRPTLWSGGTRTRAAILGGQNTGTPRNTGVRQHAPFGGIARTT